MLAGHDTALFTDIAPYLSGGAVADALSQLPAPTFERLRQAVWTVLSLDTGTAEQQHVRRGGGDAGAAGATETSAPGAPEQSDPSADQVDGDEVADLVARAQNGDPSAFGEIYDRYSETVYRYIYFRVNNAQLAEDLASETFLRALRRISSFSWQGRAFGAWLVTIARNLVVDHFKSGRYRLEIVKPDVLGADAQDADPSTSPETAALEKLTNATLLTAVKKLNPDQQECIVLRFLQGFTVAETARTMGKNEGAVKALQYRAVRTLARLLPDGFRG
ncbi:sigma-70 family RNA polymerase sigma factor [Glycomyces sp. TRM65418]|uniref:ECF subfamily RNA polymerase sigma factor, BldN family n=1 Tax=Glycomyces sp. TRM65418 TaxID=2867006 RepID=UPI001CE6E194|nr:ECF subfamily RNA polymerase sigma factor, BldN family [Glycomyces sp. TRM65418]MCC3763528.1 sigma-70 family RNA polymerase sigma factor [Glycomyces sp. TRM65418]QZD57511.1 sigma-70 family RNA polymerase sigma factor [Glycomyces sp. TRM65418]